MAKEVNDVDRIDNLTDLNVKFKERYLMETEDFFVGKFSAELDSQFFKIKNT